MIPECDVPEGVLSDAEIDVLNRIYEKFKNFGSVEISDYSHKRKRIQRYKDRRNHFICLCDGH